MHIIKFEIFLILIVQILILNKLTINEERLEHKNLLISHNNNRKNRNNNIQNISKVNEIDNEKYIQYQSYFCQNKNIFKNILIEEKIKKTKANLSNTTFDMYIYKDNDIVSKYILRNGAWESSETQSLLSSLLYYTKKKNISKKDVYVLDIGANIGWYSIFLGNNGFNIISFEPSPTNYYILLKNYCLNQNIDMIIINKGLDIEEKNTTIYHPLKNSGDAIVFHNNFESNKSNFFSEEIKLTKLNNYIEFLKDKYLALIKLDIEGSEGKAIRGGIDLIIKYHIPFIFMEFQPKLLKNQGTDPKEFLEIFENNGYKISEKNFFNQNYASINDLIKRRATNLYIVYIKFLD